jgi:hypothetical protein
MTAPLPTTPARPPTAAHRAEGAAGGASRAAEPSGRHQAWRQAMERELCQSWFRATPVAGAPRVEPHGVEPTPGASPAGSVIVGAACATRPAASAPWAGSPTLPPARFLPDAPAGCAVAASPGGKRPPPVARAWASPETAPAAYAWRAAFQEALAAAVAEVGSAPAPEGGARSSAAPPAVHDAWGRVAGEYDPIHAHAEWSEEGVRLWLRVDPRLPVADVARQLVLALRPRCADRGAPLLSVVCNGRGMWRRPDPFHPTTAQETP